jgi:adenosylmethionine-8-amino-7-oxononanoate aminotransferase
MIDGPVVRGRIETFGRLLDAALAGHPGVSEVRQRGLAAAIDLDAARGAGRGEPDLRLGLRVCLRARARGLLLRPLGDSLLIVPPLCLDETELAELVRRTAAAIDDATPP